MIEIYEVTPIVDSKLAAALQKSSDQPDIAIRSHVNGFGHMWLVQAARHRERHLEIVIPKKATKLFERGFAGYVEGHDCHAADRSEERRVGKSVSVRVDLGGRRIIIQKTSTPVRLVSMTQY